MPVFYNTGIICRIFYNKVIFMVDYNSYQVRVTPSMLGIGNIIRPDAILEVITSAIDADMCALGHGVSQMLDNNLAWVITAVHAEILKPINKCTPFTARTRPFCKRGPFICREIILENDNIQYLRVLLTSALFDTKNRVILYDVPESLGVPALDRNGFPAKRKIEEPLTFCCERKINNSELDCIGHVNNSRYAAFVYDILSDEKLSRMNELKGFYINFRHELKKENTLLLEKGETCSQFFVRGSVDGEVSFDAILDF